MTFVSQLPHELACQHACLAMLAGKTLDEVIAVVGHVKRLGVEDREKVVHAFDIQMNPRSSFLVAAFAMDGYKNIVAMMREHRTLYCSVNDYTDINYGHAVVIHEGVLYDPWAGINPRWPWSRVISQATPVQLDSPK